MSISAVGSGASQYVQRPMPSPEERAARFEQLDTDGDGGLSLTESGLTEDVFAKMDIDGDGVLTEADRQAAGPPPMGPPPSGAAGKPDFTEILSQLDSDGDGQLSVEESGFDEETAASVDSDQDGFITQAELDAALAALQQSMGEQDAMGPGGPGRRGMSAYQAQMNFDPSGMASWGGQSGAGGLSLTV